MDIFRPDKKLFKKNYDSGKPQLLYSILSADLNTPVSVLLKFKKEKYSFLLESVEKGSNKGRYSVLGIKPDLIPAVIDQAPSKQDKFLPGSHIPIMSPKFLKEKTPDALLLFPWNLKKEISSQYPEYKLVTAIPSLQFHGFNDI